MLGAKGLMEEWATIIIVINSFLILDIGEGTLWYFVGMYVQKHLCRQIIYY